MVDLGSLGRSGISVGGSVVKEVEGGGWEWGVVDQDGGRLPLRFSSCPPSGITSGPSGTRFSLLRGEGDRVGVRVSVGSP